jgi:CHAT domain-containing protein
MKHFYTFWSQGASKSVALKQAALRLRYDFPHPFFWAPFVLIGKP